MTTILASLLHFLQSYKDEISSVTAILGSLALLLGAIGLHYTRQQMKATERRIQAQTLYQIYKDFRELSHAILSQQEVARELRTPSRQESETESADRLDAKRHARMAAGELLQLHFAAHVQRDHGVLDQESWKPLERDLGEMLKFAIFVEVWRDVKKNYPRSFRLEVNAMIDSNS